MPISHGKHGDGKAEMKRIAEQNTARRQQAAAGKKAVRDRISGGNKNDK